jgi:hypothetical protein
MKKLTYYNLLVFFMNSIQKIYVIYEWKFRIHVNKFGNPIFTNFVRVILAFNSKIELSGLKLLDYPNEISDNPYAHAIIPYPIPYMEHHNRKFLSPESLKTDMVSC